MADKPRDASTDRDGRRHETLYAFLPRRERELQNIAAALRGDLAMVENELAVVRSQRSALKAK